MERDERASSLSWEPLASELESVGMISHPAKGSSFEAKYPAQFEMWQNVWSEKQITPSSFWQYESIRMMNLVEERRSGSICLMILLPCCERRRSSRTLRR